MAVLVDHLTSIEQDTLEQCEHIIERGLKTFYEVGLALLAIRDQRLYRTTYPTFEAYCRERWGMSRQHGSRMIEAALVIDNLSPIGLQMPENERQVRPLIPLAPQEQQLAWQVVKDTAPKGKVTASHVKSVVTILKEVMLTGAIDNGEGVDIPIAKATTQHLKAAITEETYERMIRNEIRIVERLEQQEQRQKERLERLQRLGSPSLTTQHTYPIIYADPPWLYEHTKTENRAVENHYPTMTLEAICALPVSDLATPDAILFCWATSPKLAEALQVIAAWGFTYRTSLVWVKDKIGMGYYARQRHELLLIATQGEFPVPLPPNRPDSVITAPRQQHSRKPHLVYDIIQKMYPDLPRIELFCRTPQLGWDVWGNEV